MHYLTQFFENGILMKIVGESVTFAKIPLTYVFPTMAHKIQLFASLDTFSNFFHYKTQEQPIRLSLFTIVYQLFSINYRTSIVTM